MLSGGINLILYILLAAVFLYGLIRGVAPLTAARQALLRGTRSIRKGDKAKRSWRDEGFLGRTLEARWSAFLANQRFLEEQFEGAAKVRTSFRRTTSARRTRWRFPNPRPA
jgi:hypothetical protein